MSRINPYILRPQIAKAIKPVIDPELFVSLVGLGLIYNIFVKETGDVTIQMTLTSMGCPLFPVMEKDIQGHALKVPGVKSVQIELVFDPVWSIDMADYETKVELGV